MPIEYVFDPKKLRRIAQHAMRKNFGDIYKSLDYIMRLLKKLYPHIDFMPVIWVPAFSSGLAFYYVNLYVSIYEHILIWGTELGATGMSQRWPFTLYNFVYEGKITEQTIEKLNKPTDYLPGSMSMMKPMETRNVLLQPHTWSLEYGRGELSGMFRELAMTIIPNFFVNYDTPSIGLMLSSSFGPSIKNTWKNHWFKKHYLEKYAKQDEQAKIKAELVSHPSALTESAETDTSSKDKYNNVKKQDDDEKTSTVPKNDIRKERTHKRHVQNERNQRSTKGDFTDDAKASSHKAQEWQKYLAN